MEKVIQGPNHCRGSHDLAASMAARGWSRAEAAEAIGVDVSVLRRWLKGQRVPSVHNAARIEAIFSIAARAWSETGRVAA